MRTIGARGFTLLEVMIAVAIIAGVVFTVIGVVNNHLAVASRDRDEGVAVLLGRQMLDDLDTRQDIPEKSNGTFAPVRSDYAWVMTSTATQVPGFRKVTVAISWDNTRRTVSLVRYVAK